MKDIATLKYILTDKLLGKYKTWIGDGPDVWIVASGATMNFVDPDFFENKISIGVNEVYRKFQTTYLVRKEIRGAAEAQASGIPLIVSRFDCGRRDRAEATIGDYVFDHLTNEDFAVDTSVIGTDKIIVSWSTITSAMHIAALMGAANIILCGHDCGGLDGQLNFKGYNLHPSTSYYDWYGQWLKGIEAQTVTVRDALQEHYHCNIHSLNPFVTPRLEGHKYA